MESSGACSRCFISFSLTDLSLPSSLPSFPFLRVVDLAGDHDDVLPHFADNLDQIVKLKVKPSLPPFIPPSLPPSLTNFKQYLIYLPPSLPPSLPPRPPAHSPARAWMDSSPRAFCTGRTSWRSMALPRYVVHIPPSFPPPPPPSLLLLLKQIITLSLSHSRFFPPALPPLVYLSNRCARATRKASTPGPPCTPTPAPTRVRKGGREGGREGEIKVSVSLLVFLFISPLPPSLPPSLPPDIYHTCIRRYLEKSKGVAPVRRQGPNNGKKRREGGREGRREREPLQVTLFFDLFFC